MTATQEDPRDRQGRLLAEALGCERVAPFGEGGESRTFRIDGSDLLASVPRGWPEQTVDPDELAAHAELLTRIAGRVSVPVPRVARVLPGIGCLVVRRLPGVPLLLHREEQRHAAGVAAALGTTLGELHTWESSAYAGLVPADHHLPAEWRDETAAAVEEVRHVLTPTQLAEVRRFLADPAPAPTSRWTLSHNDLGIEHVLVDPGATQARVTGVIDWGDAAITDPAYDFGLLLRDLGPAALGSALAAYTRTGADAWGIGERARYYAGCTLVEDLAFGLTQDRAEYVEKSLAGWERTFSP